MDRGVPGSVRIPAVPDLRGRRKGGQATRQAPRFVSQAEVGESLWDYRAYPRNAAFDRDITRARTRAGLLTGR